MRVLITGHRGFIGQHLARELRSAGHSVTGQDRADGEAYDLRYGVRSVTPVDLVIHCAATVGRAQGEMLRSQTIEDNALSSMRVATYCAAAETRLIYVSSSEAYGDLGDSTAWESPERVETLPHNLYGLTKRWGEEVTRLYYPEAQIVRLSMPYGPGYPPGHGRMALVNFIWEAMHDRPLTVHRDSARSWCYVGDTVRALRLIAEDEPGEADGWVINVGSDDEHTMSEVAALVIREVGGGSIDLVEAPSNQTLVKRIYRGYLDELGWRPEVSLQEGIRITHQWLTEYRVESYA